MIAITATHDSNKSNYDIKKSYITYIPLILSKDGLFEPIGIVVVALVLLFDFKIRLPSKVDKGNFLLEPSLDKRLFFGGAAG